VTDEPCDAGGVEERQDGNRLQRRPQASTRARCQPGEAMDRASPGIRLVVKQDHGQEDQRDE
jgi:hypothetical protein